jgi:hypothetical protein
MAAVVVTRNEMLKRKSNARSALIFILNTL